MDAVAAVHSNVVLIDSVPTVLAVTDMGRQALILHTSGVAYVRYGLNASSVAHTYRLPANTTCSITDYRGVVTAIAAPGSSCLLQVTTLK
jgi:ribosomal protein S11